MANSTITQLTADTTPTSDDLIVTVNNPGGTPANRKVTLANATKGLSDMVGDSGSGGTKGLAPAPAAGDAAAGKFLKADGTWAVTGAGGTVAGSDTQVQFNDSSAFGADADLTWDKTANKLTIGGASANTGGAIVSTFAGASGMRIGRDSFLGIDNGSGTPDAGFSKGGFRQSGLISVNRNTSAAGGTFQFPADSPAQIVGDQNNYSLGSNRSYFQRWSTDASHNITGMTISADGLGTTQIDGESHLIVNVGAQDIVLVNESGLSTDVNRFHNSTGANITLSANQAADVLYDNTTQRWRVWKRN